MASGLETIVTTDIIPRMGVSFSTANVKVGRRETDSNNDAPRVVFVALGGPIVPPDRVGHGITVAGTRARILAVRNLSVLVECHGISDEQAEEIFHQTFRACRNSVHASGPFDSQETWPDQAENEDGFDKRGGLVTFTFTIMIPIYDVDHILTTVTGFEESSETFDGEEVPCNV